MDVYWVLPSHPPGNVQSPFLHSHSINLNNPVTWALFIEKDTETWTVWMNCPRSPRDVWHIMDSNIQLGYLGHGRHRYSVTDGVG